MELLISAVRWQHLIVSDRYSLSTVIAMSKSMQGVHCPVKSRTNSFKYNFFVIARFSKMGCPALGIWVGFLKQPALPGEAPPQKKFFKKILKNKNH
jgi:hypothetical protein